MFVKITRLLFLSTLCFVDIECLLMLREETDYQETSISDYSVAENVDPTCYKIDVSQCDGNRICLLGYERDEEGCVYSCNCAKKGLFEGDISVPEQELPSLMQVYGIDGEYDGRGASIATFRHKRWDNNPDGNGNYIIPFVVDYKSLGKKPSILKNIQMAFLQYNKRTCIRLKRMSEPERDYMRFTYGPGCSSPVGRIGGENTITLNEGCSTGSVIHEIMHSLGFFHEQSRPDRDEHVIILKENVRSDAMENFRKRTDVDSLGSPYDLNSVMHYGWDYFSKNKGPTILIRKTGRKVFPQRIGFSKEDVIQINRMYKCH